MYILYECISNYNAVSVCGEKKKQSYALIALIYGHEKKKNIYHVNLNVLRRMWHRSYNVGICVCSFITHIYNSHA